MAYILTTGNSFIEFTETTSIRKTSDINKAEIFSTMDEAILTVMRAPTKTKGYYVFDMETKRNVGRQIIILIEDALQWKKGR